MRVISGIRCLHYFHHLSYTKGDEKHPTLIYHVRLLILLNLSKCNGFMSCIKFFYSALDAVTAFLHTEFSSCGTLKLCF